MKLNNKFLFIVLLFLLIIFNLSIFSNAMEFEYLEMTEEEVVSFKNNALNYAIESGSITEEDISKFPDFIIFTNKNTNNNRYYTYILFFDKSKVNDLFISYNDSVGCPYITVDSYDYFYVSRNNSTMAFNYSSELKDSSMMSMPCVDFSISYSTQDLYFEDSNGDRELVFQAPPQKTVLEEAAMKIMEDKEIQKTLLEVLQIVIVVIVGLIGFWKAYCLLLKVLRGS